jgi:hypothetical protein
VNAVLLNALLPKLAKLLPFQPLHAFVDVVEHVAQVTLPYIQFETANEPVMTVSPN